jgi:hypothetical protein
MKATCYLSENRQEVYMTFSGRSQLIAQLATCSHAGILLSFFDPEDGGDMLIQNISLFIYELNLDAGNMEIMT